MKPLPSVILSVVIVVTTGCDGGLKAPVPAAPSKPSEVKPEFPSPDFGLAEDVRTLLETADELELMSLVPFDSTEHREKWGKKPLFHDQGLIGSTSLKDPFTRRRIASILVAAIDQASPHEQKCFWPHHGIRARKGENTVELVICFSCHKVHIHTAKGMTERLISGEYQYGRELDILLTKAGVAMVPGE